jgi:hypothetical protein
VAGQQPSLTRLRPFQFDVVIHFAESRLPTAPDARTAERQRAAGNILTIVDEQKPVHTLWNLVTQIQPEEGRWTT